MRRIAVGLALAIVVAVVSPGGAAGAADISGYPASLRHIGRDQATGAPRAVDDAFIASVERDAERYGKDERPAIPPPPVAGLDVHRLAIPRLGVDAPVGRYGVDNFGRLDVPQDSRTIGWNPGYTALPGSGGATFFAAHFEFAGAPGVFARLNTLAPGDAIAVTLSDGSVGRYRVVSTVDYPLAAIDMGALLKGLEGAESITLMTCSGPPNEGEYAFRTVVLAVRE